MNLYSKYTNGILFMWIQLMGKSINLFEIHSRTLERKGYLAFGGQLTTFLCRLNSWKIIFYHLLKVNNFKAEGFSWNWLWIPDWLLALQYIWKWHTPTNSIYSSFTAKLSCKIHEPMRHEITSDRLWLFQFINFVHTCHHSITKISVNLSNSNFC